MLVLSIGWTDRTFQRHQNRVQHVYLLYHVAGWKPNSHLHRYCRFQQCRHGNGGCHPVATARKSRQFTLCNDLQLPSLKILYSAWLNFSAQNWPLSRPCTQCATEMMHWVMCVWREWLKIDFPFLKCVCTKPLVKPQKRIVLSLFIHTGKGNNPLWQHSCRVTDVCKSEPLGLR